MLKLFMALTIMLAGCSDPAETSVAANAVAGEDNLLAEVPPPPGEGTDTPEIEESKPSGPKRIDVPVPVFLARIRANQRLLFGDSKRSLDQLYEKLFESGGSFQLVKEGLSVRSLAIGEVSNALSRTAKTLELIVQEHFGGKEVILPSGRSTTSVVRGIEFPHGFPVQKVTVGLTGVRELPYFLEALCRTDDSTFEVCLNARFAGDENNPHTRVASRFPDERQFVKPKGKLIFMFDDRAAEGVVDRQPVADSPFDVALAFRAEELAIGSLTELIVLSQKDFVVNPRAFPTPRYELANHVAGDRLFEQILMDNDSKDGAARLAFLPSGEHPSAHLFDDFGFHEQANSYLTATARNEDLVRCGTLGRDLADAATKLGLTLEEPLPTNTCKDNESLSDAAFLSGILSACSQLGSFDIDLRLNPGGIFWIPIKLNLCFLLRYYHYGSKVPFFFEAKNDVRFLNEPWNTAITPPSRPSQIHQELADSLSRLPFSLNMSLLEELRKTFEKQ